jgi:hypothetical protein
MPQPTTKRVVVRQQAVHLGRKSVEVCQIHDLDGTTTDFVFIGRANASARCANLRSCARRRILAVAVEFPVNRQDKRGVFGNFQAVRPKFHALLANTRQFSDECMRIEHHAIANDRKLTLANDA